MCHKPNYVFICLAHILCYVAAHPKLRKVWEATFSVSTHGRQGSNSFIDKVMEGFQKTQSQRGGLNGSFDKQPHLGPAISALNHVAMTFNEAHAKDPSIAS